jgi:hypothetical protein
MVVCCAICTNQHGHDGVAPGRSSLHDDEQSFPPRSLALPHKGLQQRVATLVEMCACMCWRPVERR